MVTLQEVRQNPVVDSFIRRGNEYLGILGFPEHSYRHLNLVSTIAFNILAELGYPPREAELAAIAGYLHDIGNVVSRNEHGISGANLCFPILTAMGMPPDEV
ncbi:MAG: HD domain-containing protein, partial [Desulfotomaculales bacterium]